MKILIATFVMAAALAAQSSGGKPRVFVTDSESWQLAGARGGASPQTAEILKTFSDRCPNVIMTNNRERADFIVTLDHEGGKGYVRKDNKVAAFTRDGDMIRCSSTHSLGNALKDACSTIVPE